MIRVTDVELAGDFEPWFGGAQADQARITKSIYHRTSCLSSY